MTAAMILPEQSRGASVGESVYSYDPGTLYLTFSCTK